MSRLSDLASEWSRTQGEDERDYLSMSRKLGFMGRHRYERYVPALSSSRYMRFEHRMGDWLDNVRSEQDQKTLLELVADHLFFVSEDDLTALSRAAYHSVIVPWLIEQNDIDLRDQTLSAQVVQASRLTWFCAITDSMDIANFHHANGLSGADFRPDWRSLAAFGCPLRVLGHMRGEGYSHLVLLEDFVGSGSQMEEALDFAHTISEAGGFSVLVCPLICCPDGVQSGRKYAAEHPSGP